MEEKPVNIDIHVNVERVEEVPTWVEKEEPKQFIVERVKQVPKDVYIDKEVIVKKVIEVPVVNKIYKRVPKEKVVDVYEEVVKEKFVEDPRLQE